VIVLACMGIVAATGHPTPTFDTARGGIVSDSVERIDSIRVQEPIPLRMSPILDSLHGGPLQRDTVRKWMFRAVDAQVSQGFLAASAAAIGVDTAGVLDFEAAAGQRFAWGSVRDLDSTRMGSRVLSRLSGLKSGEPADPKRMEDARRRILSAGYVEEVAPPRPVREPRTALVDMVTHLRDIPSSTVEAAGAWAQGGVSAGYVEISLKDIVGTARDMDFGLSQGEAGLLAHGSWKEPWIGPLDLQLRLSGNLALDSLSRVLEGAIDLAWTSSTGATTLLAGITSAQRSEKTPGDSALGVEADEWGSRVGVDWSSSPLPPWPVSLLSTSLLFEAVQVISDTGGTQRLRARARVDAYRPLGDLVVRLGGDARGVWPLDASAGLSEALSPGGIRGWRGWAEGSPRTPAWAWATAEVRVGSSRSGGVVAFFEPGVRAVRAVDLSWSPRGSWSAGGGAELIFPGWLVELAISMRNDTQDWTEALLQVRAVNRF
jgi:hypothetical protein